MLRPGPGCTSPATEGSRSFPILGKVPVWIRIHSQVPQLLLGPEEQDRQIYCPLLDQVLTPAHTCSTVEWWPEIPGGSVIDGSLFWVPTGPVRDPLRVF